ncbi:MAG: S-adenosyl-l-methionine hydroxide adenosyltransferase family protein [Erysipelotrichaceae bacterium]|nr:S-adenosyl-l-methionine hydroxide adenosyltransferase family protein [Erysipelotrichaceae bacterium]
MANFLVFQSDFGLVDGAVSAMKGVAYKVDPTLTIGDLTHDITPYNIFEASYRLFQTIEYWPEGTVFVSVVDPGVGSNRKSVVAKTSRGQYIVTPNNGTLTHIKRFVGIEELREIEEKTNRLANSELSYTFHGRDVYAYTGARLAAGVIDFAGVGPRLDVEETIMLDLYGSSYEDGAVKGQIDILDVRFGSLWTSITFDDFKKLNASFGEYLEVQIFNHKTMVYSNRVIYGHSFADVMIGAPIIYMNSVNHMALAINQGSFAKAYNVGVGSSWEISFRKI